MFFKKTHKQKGSIYVTVLGVSTLIMVIGMSAVINTRIQARENVMIMQGSHAKSNAEAGIAFGLNYIKTTNGWRTFFKDAGGTLGPFNMPNKQGTFEITVIDTVDDNLTSNQSDPVTLFATGRDGNGTFHYAVDLEYKSMGLASLSGNMYVGGTLTVLNGTFKADEALYVKGNILSSINPIRANIDYGSAYSIFSMIGYRRELETDFDTKALPRSGSIIGDYKQIAEAMDHAKVHHSGGFMYITGQTISPSLPPYNARASSDGVYYLDCRGEKLIIENSRINATLVIDNVASIQIRGNVDWKPGKTGYPAIVAENTGTMFINNLAGTTIIEGIIYSQGDVRFAGTNVHIKGTVITPKNVISNSGTNVTMTYSEDAFLDPPTSFEGEERMMVVEESYRQALSVPGRIINPVVPSAASGKVSERAVQNNNLLVADPVEEVSGGSVQSGYNALNSEPVEEVVIPAPKRKAKK